jgi:hypothetical protein
LKINNNLHFELQSLLDAALILADKLELNLVAIRISEARDILPASHPDATRNAEKEPDPG